MIFFAQEYEWNEKTKSVILSSFFWGYVVTQIPAGQLAERYGPKLLLLISITLCSMLNILTPFCAHVGGWKVRHSFETRFYQRKNTSPAL